MEEPKIEQTGEELARTEVPAQDVSSEETSPKAGEIGCSIPKEELDKITDDIVAAIKTVYDPEIPVDIYELGLIYKVDINDERHVLVTMTLTAPGCPVAGEMPQWVVDAVLKVPGVQTANAVLTFDPPWDMSRMSDEARMALNMF